MMVEHRTIEVRSSRANAGANALARLQVEQFEDVFIASCPAVGAVSAFNGTDLTAFHLGLAQTGSIDSMARFYAWAGENPVEAEARARRMNARIERDGWRRTELPNPDSAERLKSVYFTITRECDLACAYCYQGLRGRRGKAMPLQQARATLEKIAAFNPGCHVIVTGGEPFTHPDAFAILEAIESLGLNFGVLCNGSFIDDSAAARLAEYKNLKRIQVSIDGMSAEVHAMTRGLASHAKAFSAVEHLRRHHLPLVIAPTIHEGNAHEIAEMALFATGIGAYFSPNNLRNFPHDENQGQLTLDNATLQRVVAECRQKVNQAFPADWVRAIEQRIKGPAVCSVSEPNASFICGTGHSLLDIDWNGDVYPCHLLKDKQLILGNIFNDSFDAVFSKATQAGIRVPSTEIPKCSGCKFNSRCGGGCRAGAYYAFGSLAREDHTCDINYAGQLKRLLAEAARST